MTGFQRLCQLADVAPDGTLVPVEQIRKLLAEDQNPAILARPDLPLAQIGELVSKALGLSHPVGEAGVRRWLREGRRGVPLEGRTAEDVDRFIAQVRGGRVKQDQTGTAPLRSADPAAVITQFSRRRGR